MSNNRQEMDGLKAQQVQDLHKDFEARMSTRLRKMFPQKYQDLLNLELTLFVKGWTKRAFSYGGASRERRALIR